MAGSKTQPDLHTEGLHRELWWRTAVAGTICFFIPFSLFLALANSASERHVRRATFEQLQQGATANADLFQQQLQTRAEELKALAGMLSRAAGGTLAWPQMLQEFTGVKPAYRRVLVLDASGSTVATSNGAEAARVDPGLLAQGLAGQTVFGGLTSPKPGGAPEFTVVTPIAGRREKAEWLLVADLKPDQISGNTLGVMAGPATDAFLVNNSGLIMAVLRGEVGGASGQPLDSTQANVFSGEAGVRESRDFRGEEVLFGYRKLRAFDAYFVMALPKSATVAQVRELRKTILLSVAPFLALGIVLAVIAWYYAMSRIQRLSQDFLGALVVARQRESERDLALQELGRRFDEERELNRQRSQFEAQLADYEKSAALAQLALGAAHEINNPLLGILSHLELELKDAANGEQREEIQQCIEGSKRISSTVRGLLNYARPAPLNLNAVNLDALVTETLAFLNHHPLFHGIEMKKEIPPDLPTVTADTNQLSQILMNLLLNSAQAMPDGGRVTISAEKVKFSESVNIVIADTGCGIPADILPHIFRPFFTTKRGRGTGLGLSITQAYVRSHGGKIEVESIPQRGTTVRITLPIRQEGRLVSEMEEVIV